MTNRKSASKPETHRDRELGMDAPVTRRDFVHGVGMFGAAALAGYGPGALAATPPVPVLAADYYPPARTGLRGSHPGSFEVAHALAMQGKHFAPVTRVADEYDLIVVGGGISGLASAWLYRRVNGPRSRILILDNHDDFGGHAKRNEFSIGGGMRLAWGGSINLEYPGYSRQAAGLLRSLGVDFARLENTRRFQFGGLGLEQAIYFDREHYGVDRLLVGVGRNLGEQREGLLAILDRMPIAAAGRESLRRFLADGSDRLAPMNAGERTEYLRRTSYAQFVTDRCGLTADALQVLINRPQSLWGVGADVLSVWDGLMSDLPGWHAIGDIPPQLDPGEEEYRFAMFPDGNASLARLFVRELVPAVAPGQGMDSIVTAKFNYGELDRSGAPVRIRLNSTAVKACNTGTGVAVDYVQAGRAWQVRGNHCVLACYHHMIPFLCPELPAWQRQAMEYPEKTPLIVSNVLLADGKALAAAGASAYYSPGRMMSQGWIAAGFDIGGFANPWRPEQPMVFQFFSGISRPADGKTMKERFRNARRRMLTMSFADLEREIRTHLAGMLGGHGLDPARDIRALIINRWPHGYAYEYSSLEDPDWAPGQAPHELARRPLGNIAIANSDAMAHAYVDGAIDAAFLAVGALHG